MSGCVSLAELGFDNARFWAYFLSTAYPDALLEETDQTMYDLIERALPVDVQWTDRFTRFYDGVLEERDGYIEDPTALEAVLDGGDALRIEFHPGDTLFFLNGAEAGCTGPHPKTGTVPYGRLRRLLPLAHGEVLFQLLLPMARVAAAEAGELRTVLSEHFARMGIPQPMRTPLAECLLSGIMGE